MNKIVLSQSMLKDWRKMCKHAFKQKWFVDYGSEEKSPFYIGNKEVVILGNVYEQNIIGISRGGKITKAPDDLKKKPVYQRMLEQAKITKRWLRSLPGEVVEVQHYIEVSFEMNGVVVTISGNIDINFKNLNETLKAIDLKLSSKLDASFGEFQWKNLVAIDYTQAKQYVLLMHLFYGVPLEHIEFMYHIADTSTEKRMKMISVRISESTLEEYKHELYHAFNEIVQAVEMDYFPAYGDYNQCITCPIFEDCSVRTTEPPVEIVEI